MASMETFPDHNISKILFRTESDPKHLCSLKLVSRRWNSLLTTPHFISTYITRLRRTLPPSWVVLDKVLRVTTESTIESTHFDSTPPPSISSFRVPPHILFPDPTPPLDPSPYRIPSIIWSSNGLMLFAVKFSGLNDRLYVANPVTNQWAPVPNPSDELDRKALGFAVGLSSWGVVDRVVVAEFTRVGLRYFSSDYGRWVFKVTNFTLGTHHYRYDGAFEFDGSFVLVKNYTSSESDCLLDLSI